MQSFINIHIECKHGLLEQMILYKHAIYVHKLYNRELLDVEWTTLTFQLLLISRQTNFSIVKINQKRVSNNILTNRLHSLNNKMYFSDLIQFHHSK